MEIIVSSLPRSALRRVKILRDVFLDLVIFSWVLKSNSFR